LLAEFGEGVEVFHEDIRVELVHHSKVVECIEEGEPVLRVARHGLHSLLNELLLIRFEFMALFKVGKVRVLCVINDLLLQPFVFLDSPALVALLQSLKLLRLCALCDLTSRLLFRALPKLPGSLLPHLRDFVVLVSRLIPPFRNISIKMINPGLSQRIA
jgi:hypothetical protein